MCGLSAGDWKLNRMLEDWLKMGRKENEKNTFELIARASRDGGKSE
jgi:hypothetical protein